MGGWVVGSMMLMLLLLFLRCVWGRGESERREKRLLLMAGSRWKRSVVLGTWKLSINM